MLHGDVTNTVRMLWEVIKRHGSAGQFDGDTSRSRQVASICRGCSAGGALESSPHESQKGRSALGACSQDDDPVVDVSPVPPASQS